jgi:mono/diheme cytochrome c family protein
MMKSGARTRLVGVAVALAALAVWLAAAPPVWWLNLTRPPVTDPVAVGRALVAEQGCRDCHRVGGQGALVASNLAGITARLDEAELRLWLRSPRQAAGGPTGMPAFRFSDGELGAIIEYLRALDAPE